MESAQAYSGIFSPTEFPGGGHLIIAGERSWLKLVAKNDVSIGAKEFQDFHGLLADGRKASVLQSIWRGSKYPSSKQAPYEINFFPHYVVLGKSHIRTNDTIISAIHYSFENAHCLVSGNETFRSLYPTREEAQTLLEAEHRRMEEMAKKYGWGTKPFAPEISEHPHLLYYSGAWEIASAAADIGTVSLHNRPSFNSGSSEGIWIKNEVSVTFRFHELKALPETTRALTRLHKFFELVLGRRQRLLRIELETTHAEKRADNEPAFPWHELHWSYCNEGFQGETRPTSLLNVAIRPDSQPEQFSTVVSAWLNTATEMGEARGRFATAFFRGSYDVDRLVGAANMFDLLPESHTPKARDVDPVTRDAVESCRKIFEELPHDFVRQEVLSALGRVGKSSLRDKVLHRAKLIQSHVPDRFEGIELPCIQAVKCRNHFVHGSGAEFDYRQHFGAFAFLTNTLEFVFAISDLIDLGWSFANWRENGFSIGDTELADYVINYSHDLASLKALLQ